MYSAALLAEVITVAVVASVVIGYMALHALFLWLNPIFQSLAESSVAAMNTGIPLLVLVAVFFFFLVTKGI